MVVAKRPSRAAAHAGSRSEGKVRSRGQPAPAIEVRPVETFDEAAMAALVLHLAPQRRALFEARTGTLQPPAA